MGAKTIKSRLGQCQMTVWLGIDLSHCASLSRNLLTKSAKMLRQCLEETKLELTVGLEEDMNDFP